MMDNLHPDRHEPNTDSARYLAQLEQANRELGQQVTDSWQQLSQVQLTLADVQRELAQNQQLEAERTRLLTAERELTELKSNFVLLASHEFRTPMMTILSSASLIGCYNGPTDGDNRERHVQRIKSAVGELTIMLNKFLAISQVDQNAVSVQRHPLELAPFFAGLLVDVQTTAKARQRFHYAHRGADALFTIDAPMLRHILFNLLSNASKYSAEDTDIWLTSTTGTSGLTLTVRDQGIGIPAVDQRNLFVNFFRARNAIHVQGAGLGLYLAKRYVDLLGGTITFTSQPGQGTTFRVHLPAAAPSE